MERILLPAARPMSSDDRYPLKDGEELSLHEAIRLQIESVTGPRFWDQFPNGVEEAMLYPESSKHRREMPYYWQFSLQYPKFPEFRPKLWSKQQQLDYKTALDKGWLSVVPLVTEPEPQQLASPDLEQGALEVSSIFHHHSFPTVTTVNQRPIIIEPQMVEPASPSSTASGNLELQEQELDEVFTTQTTPEQSAAIEDEVDKMLRDRLVSTLKKKLQEAKMKASNHAPEIHTLRTDLAASNALLKGAHAHLQYALEEAADVHLHEISDLKANLASRIQTIHNELQTALQENTNLKDYLRRAYEDFKAKVVRLEEIAMEKAREVQDVIRAKDQEIMRLETELSPPVQSVLETQSRKITRLQTELAEVNASTSANISQLEQANSDQTKEIIVTESVLQAQSNETMRQQTELEQFKARTADHASALETQLREARLALADHNAEIMRLKRELPEPAKCVLEAQSAEIMRLQTELENVRIPTTARICELEAQLREATNRVSGLRLAAEGKSQSTRERLEAQVNETMRLQIELENVENHNAERISELEDSIAERDDQILDLRQAAEEISLELKSRFAVPSTKFVALKSELEAVKSQSDARISELQAEIEDRQIEYDTRLSELVLQLQQAADEAHEFPAQLLKTRQGGEDAARQATSAESPHSKESYDDGFKAGWAFLFDSLEVDSELSDGDTKLAKAQGHDESSSLTTVVAICPELDDCSKYSPARIRASLSSEPPAILEATETLECNSTPARTPTLLPSKSPSSPEPTDTVECNSTSARTGSPLSSEPQTSPSPRSPQKRRRLSTSALPEADPVSSVPDSRDTDTIVVDIGDCPVQSHLRSHSRALAGYDPNLYAEWPKKRKRGRPRKVVACLDD